MTSRRFTSAIHRGLGHLSQPARQLAPEACVHASDPALRLAANGRGDEPTSTGARVPLLPVGTHVAALLPIPNLVTIGTFTSPGIGAGSPIASTVLIDPVGSERGLNQRTFK